LTRWTTAGLRGGCAAVLLLLCASLATADFTGPVASVLDGDTIEDLHNIHAERVRLSSIDCPEKGKAFGERAKTVLEGLEKEAREARKGFWADPQPVPRWEVAEETPLRQQ
jgi:endonuclease YncB( thermonuclease family)